MQRLFSLRQATKILGEQYTKSSPHSFIYSQKSTHNQLLSHPISLHRPNQHFSHSTTDSRFEIASGFFKNPAIVNQFVKLTILKGLNEGLANSRVGFAKNQLFQRAFGPRSSFQAHRRGWQSWLRRQSPDNVALGLILTNVAVFMLWRIADRQFMMNNFMISLENVKSGRVHTMITSAFSQIDVGHLVSNMIGLYFFGTSIGRNFGSDFLLKLYLAGALAGSILFLVHKGFLALNSKNVGGWGMNPSRVPGLLVTSWYYGQAPCLFAPVVGRNFDFLGASGAVNAIMLLDIFLNPRATLYLEFIIPVPAILLGIFLIGKDMLRILEGDSQVSGSAHLGGAFVAALAWARIRRRLI